MSSGGILENLDSSPPPPGTTCYICLEEGPSPDTGDRLLRNCSCRGSSGAGYAHPSCVAEHAWRESVLIYEKKGTNNNGAVLRKWDTCPNCKQGYIGDMAMAMAEAFVERTEHRPETDYLRFTARTNLACTRFDIGQIDGAQELYEHQLEVLRSGLFSMIDTRATEAELLGGLAPVFMKKMQFDKVLECLQKARAINVALHGPRSPEVLQNDQMMMMVKNILDSRPTPNANYTAARVRKERKNYKRMIRLHGKDSRIGLSFVLPLVTALEQDGQFSEAIELLEDTIDTSRRVLGPSHPDTKRLEKGLESATKKASGHTVASSETTSPTIMAVIVGVPDKPHLNGKRVQVLRPTKDGKYIALLNPENKGGKETKFKAAESLLAFEGGTPVSVRNVASKPHLNGNGGTIVSFDKEKSRYIVKIGNGNSEFQGIMKPENIEVVF